MDIRKILDEYRAAIGQYLLSASSKRFPEAPETADRLLSISLVWLGFQIRSPLEELLGVRLIEELARRRIVTWDPRMREEWDCIESLARIVDGVPRAVLCCNFRVDRFRFDFWIRYENRVTVVEADGAAWHWGQAVDRDRRKDEFAADLDWYMFRMDSSKILKDPVACAEEIAEYVQYGRVKV
jgi:hypothetical protein